MNIMIRNNPKILTIKKRLWRDGILKVFEYSYDWIREDFGYSPIKLLKTIEEYPEFLPQLLEVPASIHEGSIVKWHEWGEKWYGFNRCSNSMLGWRYRAGYYESFHLSTPEFESFRQCEEISKWTCEIQTIEGLTFSKSDLSQFSSLDHLVEKNSKDMINEITEEKLQKNLAHKEIYIIHQSNTPDFFSCYQWDRRIFLVNSGGSHHFAAARYIASRINQKVVLKGKLRIYSINPKSIDALCKRFSIFVISDEYFGSVSFLDCMKAFRATYAWRHLPRPYDNYRAIFLPKDEQRSMLVANVLFDAGAYDLGAYLTKLAESQFVPT